MSFIWDDLLTPTDQRVIELSGFGKQRPLGERPALLIIDAQWNYTGEDEPILTTQERWPFGCGERAWRAAENIKRVLDEARRIKIPVMYTRQVQNKTLAFTSSLNKTDKHNTNELEGERGVQIVDALAPLDGEMVINKSYASVFYGTPILSFLIKLKIDTLIFVGGSTSGCVRASVVDATMRNYDCVVLEDATFDRIEASHKIALLDIWMKYANVTKTDEAVSYLQSLAAPVRGH
jgi:nicotinamidase-related amidase